MTRDTFLTRSTTTTTTTTTTKCTGTEYGMVWYTQYDTIPHTPPFGGV